MLANLFSISATSPQQRRRNLLIEWTLGLVYPMLVAGPIYYINQGERFLIVEGFGCTNAQSVSVIYYLTERPCTIIPPLVSILFYYPRVVRIFYRQNRDVNRFLRSNGSVSRLDYFRVLALASVDILLILPVGIVNVVLDVYSSISQDEFPFYPGWTHVHTWDPEPSLSYAELRASGVSVIAGTYFADWSSPVLAFVIFGLFGLTAEARASYWRAICIIGGWFGFKLHQSHSGHEGSQLGTMEFGAPPQETPNDLEMGGGPSSNDTSLVLPMDGEKKRDAEDACKDAARDVVPGSADGLEKDATGDISGDDQCSGQSKSPTANLSDEIMTCEPESHRDQRDELRASTSENERSRTSSATTVVEVSDGMADTT
ncbi:hypothetical protein PENSPDRAFT_686255 [Peniophora sp. CONT]|nr:hypothetical protein PENSPDRAFT_686255 [Peniophora sp. CONT]